jgi:hypothetical protein
MSVIPDRLVLEGIPRVNFYHGGPRCPEDIPFPSVMRALDMKREHRRWGAGPIRLLLRDEFEAHDLPSERSLQRWFRQAGLGRMSNLQHYSG